MLIDLIGSSKKIPDHHLLERYVFIFSVLLQNDEF